MDRAALEHVIGERVRRRAATWFPDAPREPAVRLQRITSRPRALMYAAHLEGSAGPSVLAKVRLEAGPPNRSSGQDARPRLAPYPLKAPELTTLEYHGLQTIQTVVHDATDTRFGYVRPLDLLPSAHVILMEYVAARTLRQLLLDGSWVLPHRRARPAAAPEPWRAVGGWLRFFQERAPRCGLPSRQDTRTEVVDMYSAYEEFFARRCPRLVADLPRVGADLAGAELPARLPLAVGHGDFAPRNVFLDSAGLLRVFDPMPRWSVPRLEDLCRFLVGIRLQGLRLHSHGLAYSSRLVERIEDEVVQGYYGDRPVPWGQVRAFQLLIMLDKWSALVDTAPAGWAGRVRARSLELASGHLRREGWRLLELASRGR